MRRSLVSRRRFASAITSRVEISGCSVISARMSGTEHRDHVGRLDRFHGRRAPLVLEHRELSEDVARAEARQRDRAAVSVVTRGARVAATHDVAGVARVALAEHDLAGLEAPRHRQLGDPLEVAGHERGENGHPPEQLHDLLRAYLSHSCYGLSHARRSLPARRDAPAPSDAPTGSPRCPHARRYLHRQVNTVRLIALTLAALALALLARIRAWRLPDRRRARPSPGPRCAAPNSCGRRSTSATPPTSRTRSGSAARCPATGSRTTRCTCTSACST